MNSKRGEIILIGCGFAKTGTYSLKHALSLLNLRCYHFEDIFLNPGHSQIWADYITGGVSEVGELVNLYHDSWVVCTFVHSFYIVL